MFPSTSGTSLNNPLYAIALERFQNNESPFQNFSEGKQLGTHRMENMQDSSGKNYLLIVFKEAPEHALFAQEGFKFQCAYLRINEHITIHPYNQPTAQYYTAFYKRDESDTLEESRMTVEIHFNLLGGALFFSTLEITDSEVKPRGNSVEIESQLERNAAPAQKIIEECNLHLTLRILELMTQLKEQKEQLEEKALNLSSPEKKEQYLKDAEIFLEAVAKVSALRTTPLDWDVPVIKFMEQIVDHNTIETNDLNLLKDKIDKMLNAIEDSYQKLLKLQKKSLTANQLIKKLNTAVLLKKLLYQTNLLPMPNDYSQTTLRKETIIQTCQEIEAEIDTLFFEKIEAGDLTAVQELQENVPHIRDFPEWYYLLILRKAVMCDAADIQSHYKKICAYFYQNDPLYRSTVQLFSTEIFSNPKVEVGFAPIVKAVERSTDTIFRMLIEHGYPIQHAAGTYWKSLSFPLIQTLALYESKQSVQHVQTLLKMGISIHPAEISKDLSPATKTISQKYNKFLKKQSPSQLLHSGNVTPQRALHHFIAFQMHAHSVLQLLCYFNKQALSETEKHFFKNSNFDLATLMHGFATLGYSTSYRSRLVLCATDSQLYIFNSEKDANEIQSEPPFPSPQNAVHISMAFIPTKQGELSQIHLLRTFFEQINALLKDKTDEAYNALVLQALEQTQNLYPEKKHSQTPVPSQLLRFNFYAQLLLLILLKNKTMAHLTQMMELWIKIGDVAKETEGMDISQARQIYDTAAGFGDYFKEILITPSEQYMDTLAAAYIKREAASIQKARETLSAFQFSKKPSVTSLPQTPAEPATEAELSMQKLAESMRKHPEAFHTPRKEIKATAASTSQNQGGNTSKPKKRH